MGTQRRLDDFSGPDAPILGPPPARTRPHPPAPDGTWRVEDGWVVHPFVRPGTLRAVPFQLELARLGLTEDLLVVLPTGLGKTVIAALLAAELLRRGDGKVVFLAPTRPLVEQHAESFSRWLTPFRSARFTGSVRRPSRAGSWEESDLVFATPEIVRNDLAAGRYALDTVDLLVLDEAHHAVGEYAYVRIAADFLAQRASSARLLGLTASPGGKDERIEEVVAHLGHPRVEARTREDDGVREFVQPVDIDYRWVELPPPVKAIQAELKQAERDTARRLQRIGFLRSKPIASLSLKDILAVRQEIFARPGPMTRKFGPLFHQLQLMHLHHALERLETQGVAPFLAYVRRVADKEKPSRGDRAFLSRPEVVRACAAAEAVAAEGTGASHPKLDALVEIVREELARPLGRPPRILVFAQYRDTIQTITAALEGQGWTVGRFVGQATRDSQDVGMTQREQSRILDAFRHGAFPVLVASSVAEEGLDVPDVDLVVFFESIPSEIRTIQRRGRTGRSSVGRVIVLLTAETRDVGYQRAEVQRERAMRRIVRRLARARTASAETPSAPADSQGRSREAPAPGRTRRAGPSGS